MSRTVSTGLSAVLLTAVALATACGSQATDAPDPAPDPTPAEGAESPVTSCPPSPDIVLRRWVQSGCADTPEKRLGPPYPSG